MQLRGISGQIYEVCDDKIAGGGEGSIHEILNEPGKVAKVFKPANRTSMRENKLIKMVNIQLSEDSMDDVTWPQDVLYCEGHFIGYTMQKLNSHTRSISFMYSSGDSVKYDLRYRLMVAVNLCYAVKAIHEMNQVCGDMNPQNICVNYDMNDRENAFQVTLVDTDSYHIQTEEGRLYRCEVGLADYLAPELQNKISGNVTLRNAPLPTYTKYTDLFALAVHIFTLLMNGCHPFACAKDNNGILEHTMNQMDDSYLKDSVTAPQPIDNIRDGFFPFYEKRPAITYPIYAPGMENLPRKLIVLFIRTFAEGYNNPEKRVDTTEWIEALLEFKNQIVQCSEKPFHYYFNHNTICPLCRVDENMHNIFSGVWEDEELTYEELPEEELPDYGQSFIMSLVFLVVMITIIVMAYCQ